MPNKVDKTKIQMMTVSIIYSVKHVTIANLKTQTPMTASDIWQMVP